MSKNKKNKKGLFDSAPTGEPPIPFIPTDENERRIAELERTVSVLVKVVAGTLQPVQGWHPMEAIKELKTIAGVEDV